MLKICAEKVTAGAARQLQALCPFGAFEYDGEALRINAACKVCRLCVKNGPPGMVQWQEEAQAPAGVDKAAWRGIAVFAEQFGGRIAPVVYELLGKARALADETAQPVYALLVGENMQPAAHQLLCYGADVVYVYDHAELKDFRVLPYAAAFTDFIQKIRPSSVLVGATNLGRSLAPRVAARFKTGLTADCTRLEIKADTDLVQIRPAFGGNIMAQIVTPGHRPQFCTVRYKIFSPPALQEPRGRIEVMSLQAVDLCDATQVLQVLPQEQHADISEAEAIVAVGRGIKAQKDLAMARHLAAALGAQMACTRPLIEKGWFDAKKQIGLSGRTVKPKIIVTLGVSGSVQFAAGMQNADLILAVNNDPAAPIFNIAHYAMVGDVYEVLPILLGRIQNGQKEVG